MVTIGVDAHKKSHTVVAVDDVGRKLGERTVAATDDGHAKALRWVKAEYGTEVVWALEDCRGVTTRLERTLLAAGDKVIRVPPHLTARVRRTSREPGKSDPIDALQVARAALREPDLPVAFLDPISREMNLLVDRRSAVIEQRSATISRLLWRIHELDPEHAITGVQLGRALHRGTLAGWLAKQSGLVAELAHAELDDVVRQSTIIDELTKRIRDRVRAVAPTLVAMPGCGELTAAKIVGEVANVTRFRNADAFASYAGVAPIPNWSGGHVRHRAPQRPGNRQLNSALHTIAKIQIQYGHAGKAYYQRRTEAGDAPRKARRALKRRIAHAVYRRLRADQHTQDTTGIDAARTSFASS